MTPRALHPIILALAERLGPTLGAAEAARLRRELDAVDAPASLVWALESAAVLAARLRAHDRRGDARALIDATRGASAKLLLANDERRRARHRPAVRWSTPAEPTGPRAHVLFAVPRRA